MCGCYCGEFKIILVCGCLGMLGGCWCGLVGVGAGIRRTIDGVGDCFDFGSEESVLKLVVMDTWFCENKKQKQKQWIP